MQTAIVIGATGLVGRSLVNELLSCTSGATTGDAPAGIAKVKTFARRPTGIEHPALDEHIIDFDQLESWAAELTGDLLFSALGTTRSKARSKAAQRRVDVDYQLGVAKAAAANGVRRYLLVSSIGANARSRWFYPRIKGELEEAVQTLGFGTVAIFRPSVLVGKRDHARPGERLGELGARVFGTLPGLRTYRPISGRTVAEAMVSVALDTLPEDTLWFESDAIAARAKSPDRA